MMVELLVEQGWLVVELEWCSVEAGEAVVVAAARGGVSECRTSSTQTPGGPTHDISRDSSPDIRVGARWLEGESSASTRQ